MLHMIVNTHNPESCAYRSTSEAAATSAPIDRFEQDIATRHGLVIQGSWVNRPAHELFILVNAPNSHDIDEALIEAGLIGRTHTRVLSVVPVSGLDPAATLQAQRADASA